MTRGGPSVARALVREHPSLILADLYTRFKALCPREEYRAKYASDGVHPTAAGEEESAKVLFKAVTGEDKE